MHVLTQLLVLSQNIYVHVSILIHTCLTCKNTANVCIFKNVVFPYWHEISFEKQIHTENIYIPKKYMHTYFQFISLSVSSIGYARTTKTKQKLLHSYLHALSNVLVIMKGCTGMQRDMKWRHCEHHGWLTSLNGPSTASTIMQQPWTTPSWCALSLMNTWLNSNWL